MALNGPRVNALRSKQNNYLYELAVFSKGIKFHYDSIDELKVITWSHQGLTYALVSDLEMPAQQSCVVCHRDDRQKSLPDLGIAGKTTLSRAGFVPQRGGEAVSQRGRGRCTVAADRSSAAALIEPGKK